MAASTELAECSTGDSEHNSEPYHDTSTEARHRAGPTGIASCGPPTVDRDAGKHAVHGILPAGPTVLQL
jgi:hypothetical protein